MYIAIFSIFQIDFNRFPMIFNFVNNKINQTIYSLNLIQDTKSKFHSPVTLHYGAVVRRQMVFVQQIDLRLRCLPHVK